METLYVTEQGKEQESLGESFVASRRYIQGSVDNSARTFQIPVEVDRSNYKIYEFPEVDDSFGFVVCLRKDNIESQDK